MTNLKSLRIVLVLIDPPLPFGNASGRWVYVLFKGLVERGHRVTAFAACSKSAEMEQARALFPAPAFDLRCYPFPKRGGLLAKLETIRRPYSYMFGQELRHDLKVALAEGFDILHLEQLWGGWVAQPWRMRALLNVHYLFSIDLEFADITTFRERMSRWLMVSAERQLLRGWRHVATLSARLTAAVENLAPGAHLHAVKFGLDLALYPYIPDDRRTSDPVVSVIGSMDWYPSHSAAVRLVTRLWPAIRRRMPAARLQIVGWRARSTLSRFLNEPGLTND